MLRPRTENFGESGFHRRVHLAHGNNDTLPRQRRDAMRADAAGNDATVVVEIGVDVEGDAVEAHPMPHADAERGDLVLAPTAPGDPDADATSAPLALQIESGERADHPVLEPVDIGPQIAAAA